MKNDRIVPYLGELGKAPRSPLRTEAQPVRAAR
jgi:hypothetical protein